MTYDDDKKLEEGIRMAYPKIKAPEPFKQTLKQDLLRKPARRKNKTGWLYTAAAVAAVLILTFTFWPDSPGTPPVNLPLLPPLTSTGPVTQGASGGPGFTVELTYEIGQLSALPAEANAYRYKAIPFSEAALAALAVRLGIPGEVREEPWQDGITYVAGSTDDKIVLAFPSGYYNYSRPIPDSWGLQSFPAEEELVTAAKGFLPSLGIDPAGVQVRDVKIPGNDDYAIAYVTFTPKAVPRQISVSPYAQLQVGPDGEIYSAAWVWPTELEDTQSYPLGSVQEAWADIEDGKGIIAMNLEDVVGPTEGTVLTGTGTIQENYVGYILTYDAADNVVIQPVAAFSGTATLEGGQEVPFTVYTQAVLPEHY